MTQPKGATTAMVEALAQPTPKDQVKHRPGPGNRQLSYVDARFVMDRLDATVLPENWQDDYQETALGVACRIGINVNGEWVWKGDIGSASDIEPAKGAYSDAFKRAAVKWGIGRDLYDGEHSTSGGREASSARPAAPIAPTNGHRAVAPPSPGPAARAPEPPEPPPLFDGDEEFQPIGTPVDVCPIHNVEWRGETGDLWHKDGDGKYCRHPANVKRPAAARR